MVDFVVEYYLIIGVCWNVWLCDVWKIVYCGLDVSGKKWC